jgi:Ca-activated chloride channel family protein
LISSYEVSDSDLQIFFGGIFMYFKGQSANNSKVLVSLVLLFSIVFSACSLENNSDVAQIESPQHTDRSAANSNMSATPAPPMVADSMANRAGSFEEKSASGERYAEITENPFWETSRAPLSTFSIDVDTASYANMRRFINQGSRPPKDSVRIEELINYFEYDYPQPIGDVPFSVNTDVANAPWNSKNKIVQIGLQGRKVSIDNLPPSNLVFLIDVSGSMNSPERLPLLQESFKILLDQLNAKDRVAIVTYAGNSGLLLPSTTADRKNEIIRAVENLQAGGSTNGGQGIQLAYKVALDNFIQNGNNRVILATDGDFNVGVSSDEQLVSLIEQKRQSGVFLSVFGFGLGNYNDSMMEKLSNKGNGNYAYIDSLNEAKKALGEQIAGTLYTIAKDVKIQVEFNPAKVAGYRLIGYENRLLADRDFNDDKKDAGEIGRGHSVTALYEIVPAGQKIENPGIDELKYSKTEPTDTRFSNELMTVKLRYKEPKESTSKLLSIGIMDKNNSIEKASDNLKFASAVAQFGLILRDSNYKGNANFNSVLSLAQNSRGSDLKNYRGEFIELVTKAVRLRN